MSVQPFLLPAYLALCLVLGGASAAGVAANMLLQLLALPLLLIAALGNPDLRLQPPARQLLTLAALALGLALVQLVPLPPFLWTGLAGRDAIARGFEMLGVSLPWLPISLAPQQTLAAILWLLPALAVLVAVLRLENFRASWIAWTILAVTGLAVLFGALQSAGGMDSPWYFYEITNYGVAVGLFANANHMATMLVAAIPFLAALFVASRGGSRQRASAFSMMLAGALLVVFVGIGVNRSLAAIGLSVPVLAASGLMIWMRKR
ncbi:MAG: O-antigen ligase family protein, partial [Sphingosinicella sp.]